MNRLLRIPTCVVVALGCIALLALPPSAAAQPATTPIIGWNQVGLSSRIELSGSGQPSNVTLPVPQGVSPTMLTGVIGSVVNAVGRIDVFDARAVLLGSIPIPTDVAALPFEVNIMAADVSTGGAKLSFVIRNVSEPADSCTEPPQVTLSQLATTYTGPMPNPRTIADFLPGYLAQIIIRIGPAPARDEQQAALTLVAKLTHLYWPMPVRIDVDTSSEPLPPEGIGLRRVISLRASDQPGLVVENPDSPAAVLVISGHGPDLLRQVEMFADRRFELVQTPTASVTSAQQTGQISATRKTFGELGISGETSVLGRATMYIGFDAAAFAVGPIERATVHLIANYSPVIAADASVILRSGSVVVASEILDESGVLDLTGDIPAGPIGSQVGLALEIRYVPGQECAPVYDRIAFFIDPASTVDVLPGTNNRGGFPVLPMAFTPEFDVALDSPDQIRYAAQAINLMGQNSTVALQPNVTTLQLATDRRVGLLVVGGAETLVDAGMQPPLLKTGVDALDVNGRTITGIDLNGPLGIVEAFSHNDRMVLAIETSGDGSLTDISLDHIRGVEGRWASLTGDVIATGASGVTVALTVRAGGSMAHQPIPSEGWMWWTWFTLAVGTAVIMAVALMLIVRHRRTKT